MILFLTIYRYIAADHDFMTMQKIENIDSFQCLSLWHPLRANISHMFICLHKYSRSLHINTIRKINIIKIKCTNRITTNQLTYFE